MNILVTNDDGITEPGLFALAETAMAFGDVYIIAPDSNRSACGHQKTLRRPMRVDPISYAYGLPAWKTDGSPSDCAALGILGFLGPDIKVDIVLSGINPTCNLAQDLTYSGTVTAALEAAIWDLPAVAFSLDCPKKKPSEIDFTAAKAVIQDVLRAALWNGIPTRNILNVNIPDLPYEAIAGYRVTSCGRTRYRDVLVSCTDPFGRPYYWFGGEPPSWESVPGSDTEAVAQGYVSLTPLHADLTDVASFETLTSWNVQKSTEE